MDAAEIKIANRSARSTPFAVALLALAAATFSYIGAFAVPQALVTSNVIRPWPPPHDPRLRWMIAAFTGLMLTTIIAAIIWRHLSSRQLKRIDAMVDAEELEA